jgi:hypothetical protein
MPAHDRAAYYDAYPVAVNTNTLSNITITTSFTNSFLINGALLLQCRDGQKVQNKLGWPFQSKHAGKSAQPTQLPLAVVAPNGALILTSKCSSMLG